MYKSLLATLLFLLFLVFPSVSFGATIRPSATPNTSPVASASATPLEVEVSATPVARVDFTQKTEENLGPLEKLLTENKPSKAITPFNFLKHSVFSAVSSGVPANTLVLLLLLPLIAFIIAAARHIVGVRGFGIFLPASLSVVFLAIGPVVGLVLFFVIVASTSLLKSILKKMHLRLQYLPRLSLVLWFVVVGVLSLLFLAPYIPLLELTNVSIFPVLILVLLAEDFSRVQMGKSAKTAFSYAFETILLALTCYLVLTFRPLQEFALLNPELLLFGVAVLNVLMGKYVGLRFVEYWRFRKLIRDKRIL